MKKQFSIITFLLFCSTVFSQNILITDPDLGTGNPMPCTGVTPPNFFDSGNNAANYGANENETILICPDYAGGTSKLSLTFGVNTGLVFDVDPSDTVFVYDGLNTAAPLLGAHNSATDPTGFNHIASFANNPTGCLTIQFVSDGVNEGTGWDASITCLQSAQPFEIYMAGYHNGVNNIITPADTGYSDVCLGDSILFVASPVFPNSSDATGIGYSQNNTNITYEWAFSNGLTSNNDSVWFTPPANNGYVVSLKITDQFPYSQTITSKVRVSSIPNFAGVLVTRDSICVGDTTLIIGAVANGNTYGVDPTTTSFQLGGSVAGQVYLPDGSGISYYDTINISGFIPGDTVANITDLQQLCLDMEHSFLGDLEMQLTCPNGTTIDIFNSFTGNGLSPGGFGGGATYLGHPVDNNLGTPGSGEEYCWSSTLNTYGDFPTEFAANNFVALTSPPSPSAGNSMNWNGIYAPEQSFTNLVGCPLNGDWSITIRDNLGIDDGYIFEWSILFDPILNPNNETYQPVIVSAQWLSAATVLPGLPTDTFIVVSSNLPGTQNYTFEITDDFGCMHDTTVSVEFSPLPSNQILPGNITVCQGTTVNFDINGIVLGNNAYDWSPGQNLSDSLIVNPLLNTDTLSGLTTYTVVVTDTVTSCTTDTTQDITVIPGYILASTQSDTNICVGDVINFTTTPSLSGSYTYNWTSNTGVFGTPTDSLTTGTFNTPGSDTVIVSVSENSGSLGCVRTDTLYVNVSSIPILSNVTLDTTICIDGTATLYGTASGGTAPVDLIWNAGLIGNGPHNVTPTAITNYSVFAQDATGCVSPTQNILVDFLPPITINSIEVLRDTVCKGDTTTVKVRAIGGGTDLFYTWYNGGGAILGVTAASTIIVTPTYDGELFTVIVSDSCTTPTQTESIPVYWSPITLPTYIVTDFEGCFDQIFPTITNTTANLNNMDSVFWDFGDGDTSSFPFATPIVHSYDNPGFYDISLTLTDNVGCVWDTVMTNFQIKAHDYPHADFLWNPNPTDYLNAEITFDNQSVDNAFNEWVFITNAQNSSNDIDPVFQFPQHEPGNYDVTLKVTNEFGCQDSISKIVVIDDVFLFYIPTAFTPDGDGLNDKFRVVGEGLDLTSYKMTIFNKWGELVFESSNPDIGWDGTYKGDPVKDGVYIWKIDAKEAHSPIVHRKDGFITIVR